LCSTHNPFPVNPCRFSADLLATFRSRSLPRHTARQTPSPHAANSEPDSASDAQNPPTGQRQHRLSQSKIAAKNAPPARTPRTDHAAIQRSDSGRPARRFHTAIDPPTRKNRAADTSAEAVRRRQRAGRAKADASVLCCSQCASTPGIEQTTRAFEEVSATRRHLAQRRHRAVARRRRRDHKQIRGRHQSKKIAGTTVRTMQSDGIRHPCRKLSGV